MYKPQIDYDYEIESAVLGVCLAEPTAFSQCRTLVDESCFYGLTFKKVFEAIHDRFEKGYPVDLLTVSRFFFDKGKVSFDSGETIGYALTKMMFGIYSSAHLESWCLMLRELSAKRMMIELRHAGGKNDDVFDVAADIEMKIKKILEVRSADDWKHISQVAVRAVKQMEGKDAKKLPGITTSIELLDNINGGFRPGDFVIIGARPGVGKSAFMGRLAAHAAHLGYKVGIISLEMDDVPLFNRMLSFESNVEYYKIDRNDLREQIERERVYSTIASLSALPIHFSDTAQVSMSDIRGKVEKLKKRHGVDMVIIDYLQLIEAENEKSKIREQEVAKISRGCKLLAKLLQIPLVLLAQLNRGAVDKKAEKPALHHLRESGSLEQDADVVMFLHRDFIAGKTTNEDGGSTEMEADLIAAKWRNGATMEIKIGYEPTKMKFFDPEAEKRKTESLFAPQPPDNPSAGINRAGFQPPSKKPDAGYFNDQN